MVLHSLHPTLDNFTRIKKCCPTSPPLFTGVPLIDLSHKNAKSLIHKACLQYGFFKVTNHAISMDFLSRFEDEALNFFRMSQPEKDLSGPPSPFGYGCKNIGPNGDVGWVEYLLFCANSHLISKDHHAMIPGLSDSLWEMVEEYMAAVKDMTCKVVEMIADEMGTVEKDVLSKLIRDEKSDSCFRVNHYPTCPQPEVPRSMCLLGFGEHTDPQIISVLRSNNASGLQICLQDGSWLSVPADETSFFFSVGDTLQVMTNGRYKSIKHRVCADGVAERMSMIYFGGPPLEEVIRPIWIEEGEESRYYEFTWLEYKKSAYKSKLGDNRLARFEKAV